MTQSPARHDGGHLPPSALWLGWAGVLPFGLLALATWCAPWRDLAAQGFLAYGALILSFLGGVRWGRAMACGARAWQFAGSVLPSLWGWLAWFLLPPAAALGMLAIGFALVARWDGRSDLLAAPVSFRRLRLGLSTAVLALHGVALAGLWVARS
ncbi:MAG: DUF3429 domain-containing protein [Hydrogenophaga sp.]|nr:DUF3429 domain-containing protein [Hydrogenophaga sp.]